MGSSSGKLIKVSAAPAGKNCGSDRDCYKSFVTVDAVT